MVKVTIETNGNKIVKEGDCVLGMVYTNHEGYGEGANMLVGNISKSEFPVALARMAAELITVIPGTYGPDQMLALVDFQEEFDKQIKERLDPREEQILKDLEELVERYAKGE